METDTKDQERMGHVEGNPVRNFAWETVLLSGSDTSLSEIQKDLACCGVGPHEVPVNTWFPDSSWSLFYVVPFLSPGSCPLHSPCRTLVLRFKEGDEYPLSPHVYGPFPT